MAKLRINVRVDRYAPAWDRHPINKYFDIICQVLRFDKDMNLVATLSHTHLIKLRDNIDKFIIKNELKGREN